MKKLENSYCTQIQSKGKTVYDAPIRIVNKHDLKNYGITWKDCVRLHIGVNETINVYMYKTKDPKLADFFWSELNAEYSRNNHSIRCFVPGKQKIFIECPKCNKCSNLSFCKNTEVRKTNGIEYEEPNDLMSSGEDYPPMTQAESEIIYEDLIASMRKIDPLIAEVFIKYYTWGYNVPEIATELGIDSRTVYYLKKQAEQIRDRQMRL